MLTKKKCKEALEQLDLNCWGCEYACDMSDDKPCVLKEIIGKLINEHFELVEKAAPKKPLKVHFEMQGYPRFSYECPNCHKFLGLDTNVEQTECCRHCGQALSWSNEV